MTTENPPTFGLVLAGGLARRMGGGDKALLKIGRETILDRVLARFEPQCSGILLNANGDPARFARFKLPVIADDIPDFAPGDTLKVHVRVVEGNRERVQVFQGIVIRRKGDGSRETFTVRKVSFGVGVERTFPVHSPILAKIERITRGDVRRAKLYYLRDLRGKKAKIKEKRVPR